MDDELTNTLKELAARWEDMGDASSDDPEARTFYYCAEHLLKAVESLNQKNALSIAEL